MKYPAVLVTMVFGLVCVLGSPLSFASPPKLFDPCSSIGACTDRKTRVRDRCLAPLECLQNGDQFTITRLGEWYTIHPKDSTEVLHIERGKLEIGPMHSGAWSSQWKLIKAPHDSVRIQNRHRPKVFIHMERGHLEATSKIWPSAASGHWKLDVTFDIVFATKAHFQTFLRNDHTGAAISWNGNADQFEKTTIQATKHWGYCRIFRNLDMHAEAKEKNKHAKHKCLQWQCNPRTGELELTPAPGKVCDDGAMCTTNDRCNAKGKCVGQWNKKRCECKTTKDCKDDGNLCNGTPYCDKDDRKGNRCTNNPSTIVVCSKEKEDCRSNQCNPKTGKCRMAPTNIGKPCNDDDPATPLERCNAKGRCVPKHGPWNPSHFKKGWSKYECKTDAHCKDDDDDVCTGTPYCKKSTGKCKNNPASVIKCPSANDTNCKSSQCNSKTGKCRMAPRNVGKQCEDGDPTTSLERCNAKGKCAPKHGPWNPSHFKKGWSKYECKTDAHCKLKDQQSKDKCLGTHYCYKSELMPSKCVLNPATKVTCQTVSDTACKNTKCNSKTGKCRLVFQKKGAACTDGDPLTSDQCNGKGLCVGTSKRTSECRSDKDCKDDGNSCNGKLYCDKTNASKGVTVCKTNPKTRHDWLVGKWATKWGELHVTQNKTSCAVTGSYAAGKGRIAGKESGPSDSVVGRWWRPKNKTKKCGVAYKGTHFWGEVRFDFPDAGRKKFKATWDYCGKPPKHSDWLGTREADN